MKTKRRLFVNEFKLGLILLAVATFLFIPLGAFAYDRFDSEFIDLTKWEESDHSVREISDGKLRMNEYGTTRRSSTYLHLNTPVTGYLESKITVQSGSLVLGNGNGFARIGAYFYNSERGPGSYNEYEGNVWGDVQIVLENDNSLTAKATLYKMTAPDQTAAENILNQEFAKSIEYDTEYTVSMELSGSQLIFRCGDEEIIYQIQTPVYTPYDPYQHLCTRIYPEEGSAVSVKALFDDVYTVKVDPEQEIQDLVEDFVTRFYQLCLDRNPDQTGLDSWVVALLNGTQTGSGVANGFVFSQEFINKNTTDGEYLSVLYEAFFNRKPDSAGLQGWLDAMQNGASREDVLNGFIYATEFAELCEEYGIKAFEGYITKAQREAVEDFVTRFYQLCLDRDPDQAGLEGWANNLLNQIQTGADVANGFIYSQEFINKNTTNDEYLTILYKAFFNRDPDQAGRDAWMAELNSGKDRGYVLNGFLGSQEFIELCEDYGINPN